MLKPFASVNVAPPSAMPIKRRFSVTGDIVAYRQCGRRYGAYHVHGYAPAQQTQLYFGQIIHQVLDRCHAHYHGILNPATRGQVPDDGAVLTDAQVKSYFDARTNALRNDTVVPAPPSDLLRYFLEVEEGLTSRGIRAVTPKLRYRAIRVLQYFNQLEGPTLYPRVVDTEHRLQADRGDHILHGVVDVLAHADTGGGGPGDREIWDYKGTSRDSMTTDDLRTYQFQMQVYAGLYELKHGVRPQRVVLYLLNELYIFPSPPTTRPINATIELSLANGLSPTEIAQALQEFTQTKDQIEQARATDQWLPATPGTISVNQDCAICDLRWDCPTPNQAIPGGVAMRHP